MKKKYSLTLDDDFVSYCEINNITDIEKKAKEIFEKGFLFLKYGYSPAKYTNSPPTPPPPADRTLKDGHEPIRPFPRVVPLNIDKEPLTEKIIEKKLSIYDE